MAQHKHRKCIRTVIAVMILHMLEHKVQSEERQCTYAKVGGLKEALCDEMGLTSIPSGIDPDIESLKLTFNPIRQIKRRDMMKFENLKSFAHELDNDPSISIPLEIESTAFVDLTELIEISLRYVNLSHSKFIILPMKLEKISVIGSFIHNNVYDFSTLENANWIDLRNNELTVIPEFHKYAPLRFVALLQNPIDIAPVSKIVRYCQLKFFYIHLKTDDVYTTTGKDKCECRRWEEWWRRKEIRSIYVLDGIQCPSEPCDQELIPQKWEQLWDDCVNNVRDPSHDLKEDTPPPPVNSDTNVSTDQLEPVNTTPAIEKKPIIKIFYFLTLLLALIILLTAMCFYLIYRKKRQSELEYNQENAVPEQSREEEYKLVEDGGKT